MTEEAYTAAVNNLCRAVLNYDAALKNNDDDLTSYQIEVQTWSASVTALNAVPRRGGFSWGVRLGKIEGHKFNVTKAVQGLTGLPYKGARAMVESAPVTLLEGLTHNEAIKAVGALERAGAEAEAVEMTP